MQLCYLNDLILNCLKSCPLLSILQEPYYRINSDRQIGYHTMLFRLPKQDRHQLTMKCEVKLTLIVWLSSECNIVFGPQLDI